MTLSLGPNLAENLRRFHRELVKQGFTEDQAAQIVAAWVRGAAS